VDQTPHSGSTVKPRRRVYLTVNSGTARRVAVPDVLTLSVRSAQNRLRTAGLRVDSIRQDTIPAENAGTVTRQVPSPGDSLDAGEGVVLWEAQGASEEQVRVPNVYGLSVARAKRRLLRVRLRSTVLDTLASDSSLASLPRPQRNRQLFVMGQRPLPSTSHPAGTYVNLFVTSDSVQAARARPPAQDSAKADSGNAGNPTRSVF
jgi:beta-lactam-binding protein with PASTA domain